MKITSKVFGIYKALRGRGWRSAGSIATDMGLVAADLFHSLRRMKAEGILKENSTVYPIHFMLIEDTDEAEAFAKRIEEAEETFGQPPNG